MSKYPLRVRLESDEIKQKCQDAVYSRNRELNKCWRDTGDPKEDVARLMRNLGCVEHEEGLWKYSRKDFNKSGSADVSRDGKWYWDYEIGGWKERDPTSKSTWYWQNQRNKYNDRNFPRGDARFQGGRKFNDPNCCFESFNCLLLVFEIARMIGLGLARHLPARSHYFGI